MEPELSAEALSYLFVAAIWFGFGAWAAYIARNKSGGGCIGFLLGILLGPIGLIIALLLPYRPDSRGR